MPEPHLGHYYQSVYIPQLDDILAAFDSQKGLLMALQDSVAALLSTISDEFGELKDKFDALKAQVQAGQDATAALAELQAQVDAADAAIQDATTSVENLSDADADTPPVEPTP